MAKDSGIEWTHHTFNPWWGCVKLVTGVRALLRRDMVTARGDGFVGR